MRLNLGLFLLLDALSVCTCFTPGLEEWEEMRIMPAVMPPGRMLFTAAKSQVMQGRVVFGGLEVPDRVNEARVLNDLWSPLPRPPFPRTRKLSRFGLLVLADMTEFKQTGTIMRTTATGALLKSARTTRHAHVLPGLRRDRVRQPTAGTQ